MGCLSQISLNLSLFSFICVFLDKFHFFFTYNCIFPLFLSKIFSRNYLLEAIEYLFVHTFVKEGWKPYSSVHKYWFVFILIALKTIIDLGYADIVHSILDLFTVDLITKFLHFCHYLRSSLKNYCFLIRGRRVTAFNSEEN